jgi:hypothetical protein
MLRCPLTVPVLLRHQDYKPELTLWLHRDFREASTSTRYQRIFSWFGGA